MQKKSLQLELDLTNASRTRILTVLFASVQGPPNKAVKGHKTQDACGKMFGAWCKTYNRELVPYVLYHIRGMIFGTQPDAKPSALVFRLPQCQQPLGLKLEPGRGLFVNAVL